jgi:hypothetical protein
MSKIAIFNFVKKFKSKKNLAKKGGVLILLLKFLILRQKDKKMAKMSKNDEDIFFSKNV